MAMQNISKYVQINDFLLLEYEFSRDGTVVDMTDMGGTVVTTDSSVKQFYNNNRNYALGSTNNILELNATPTNSTRNTWFNDYTNTENFNTYFDSSVAITTDEYSYDTIKVHVVSGYNFDDVTGFLLQVRANDTSSNLVDLSNFAYLKQDDTRGSDVVEFASSSLYLGNKFYDKYVTFKVPSIYELGIDTETGAGTLPGELSVTSLSDVYLTYGTIATLQTSDYKNTFNLADYTEFRLPVISAADNFNVYIAESTVGDFIEFYATWEDTIIGEYMGDIESGRIPLYTSNNPNDNYQEFTEQYGTDTAKWVLIHEIYVYENLPGSATGSSLLSQKYTFTQEDSFTLPNYFRPVLKNADIDASYTIQYTCRLSNRMDGTQIIRRASFASTDPKKYGLKFTRITVENAIPYKVFNKIEAEQSNVVQGTSNIKTKYSKVYYDITTIIQNEEGYVYPNGTGPIFLKSADAVYKYKFEKYNESADQKENIDLSGVYNYSLIFTLDNDYTIEIVPTYSTNMNTTIGELEFKITSEQTTKLLKQTNNAYNIVIKNPDGTHYSFYEGKYYPNSQKAEFTEDYTNANAIASLEKENNELVAKLKTASDEYSTLKSELEAKVKSTASSTSVKSSSGNATTTNYTVYKNKIAYLTKINNDLTTKNTALSAANVTLTATNATLLAENTSLKNTTSTGRTSEEPTYGKDDFDEYSSTDSTER